MAEKDAEWHRQRMDAIVTGLWEAKSLDLHMCDGTKKEDQFGLLRDIRDSWRSVRQAIKRDARETEKLRALEVALHNWTTEMLFDAPNRLADGTPKLGKFETEELFRVARAYFEEKKHD